MIAAAGLIVLGACLILFGVVCGFALCQIKKDMDRDEGKEK